MGISQSNDPFKDSSISGLSAPKNRPVYRTPFQDTVDQVRGVMAAAQDFFGYIRLPVTIENGRLTQMPVFPPEEDPLEALMDLSPYHYERGIRRKSEALKVEFRSSPREDIFGASIAKEIRFGKSEYSKVAGFNREIDVNFPIVVEIQVQRSKGKYQTNSFDVSMTNSLLTDNVWRRLHRTVRRIAGINITENNPTSSATLHFQLTDHGAYAIFHKCQEAIIAAHKPRIRFPDYSYNSVRIDSSSNLVAVDEFYIKNCETVCQEAFLALEERRRAIPLE